MTPMNNMLRNAVKDVEAHMAAALVHQPEDDAKCGQHLYDALVYAYNAADTACHKARDGESVGDHKQEAGAKAIADIIAEMRRGPIPKHRTDNELLGFYADRFEAAARRAYNEIDSAVCGVEDISSSEIDYIRKGMCETIGDYYE